MIILNNQRTIKTNRLFEKWITDASARPVNGSIVKFTTVKDETTLSFH